MPKKLHKGWLLTRVDKLPELATTREVSDATGYSMRALQVWLADPIFLKAKVVQPSGEGNFWVWSRDRLRVWIQRVVLKLDIEQNPPELPVIPLGYQPRGKNR